MEGALEGATACCSWKLACSLLALAWLPPSRGPVGFCCCCLLLFTDVVVTAFLALLCVSKSWPGELTPRGDVVALRLLLFLGRLYAAALLLTCPLMALEALGRLRRSGGRCPGGGEEGDEGEEGEEGEEGRRGVGFLCCLAVWALVALDVRRRRRWAAEESGAAACLRAGDSLLACLPGGACSCLAFLLLLLLVFLALDPRARRRASGGQNRAPPGGPTPACARLPQAPLARGPALGQVPAGQVRDGNERGGALTSVAPEERGRCAWRRWDAAPPPGPSALMAGVGVLCVFVLPLMLSVNVVLVRAVDQLLELTVGALLVPPPADRRSRAAFPRRSGFPQAGNNLEIC